MDILLAAGEAVPFCKTGGLADVVGALARRLAGEGHRVRLILPRYRQTRGFPARLLETPLSVPMGGECVPARLHVLGTGDLRVFFVDAPRYFDRPQLYQEAGKDYVDNGERFAFFCRAVLEALAATGPADILHCHDWQSALAPAYLRVLGRAARARASVLTLHNIAYQGLFPKSLMGWTGLPWSEYVPERLEYYGQLNFLKAGIVYSDALNTVSPSYARQTRESPEFGRGLEGVLRSRGEEYAGILNGLDLEAWDPARDPHLPRAYGSRDAEEGKAACRRAVDAECALEPGGPLIASVSRLDPQKGLDVACAALPPFLDQGARFLLVGVGDPALEKRFKALAAAHRARAAVVNSFDERLAHRAYAAADIFLMPSRFEPCGLGQMIAMRYGAVPVAVRTGGLADTVLEEGPAANGFLAPECSLGALTSALGRSLDARRDPVAWSERRRRGMEADWSWGRSVREYLRLYARALERARHAA